MDRGRQGIRIVAAWLALGALTAAGQEQAMTASRSVPTVEPTIFVQFYDAYNWQRNPTVPLSGYETAGVPAGRNLGWWHQEIGHVADAGIDVMSLISGEVVGRAQHYDFYTVMLQAMRERAAAGKPNPKVVMFYDGMGFNAFRRADLDGEEDMAEFYRWLHRFFTFFIAEQNAEDVLYRFEGGFPVFIYHPEPGGGVTAVEDRLVPYVKERFERDFPGRKVYLIFSQLYWDGEYSNNRLRLRNADGYFDWGASYNGITSPDVGNGFRITTIGPGFDDRGRRDQQQEGWGIRVRDRQDGELYRREFERAIRLRDRAPWLLLETWNLALEGSEIAVTRQHGDLYVRITREMAERFRAPMTDAERRARDDWRPDGRVRIAESDAAGTRLGPDHFVRDWHVLGPVALDEAHRTDEAAREALAAETVPGEANLRAGQPAGGLAWQPYRREHDVVPEAVELGWLLGEPEYAVAYLATELVAPEEGVYTLLLGSDDYVRVYVNGQAVHTFDAEGRAAVEDADRVEGVPLRAGANRVVVKLLNLRGDWGAVLRLQDAQGRPVRVEN